MSMFQVLQSKILMIGHWDCAERLEPSGAGIIIRPHHTTPHHTTQHTSSWIWQLALRKVRPTIQDTDWPLSSVWLTGREILEGRLIKEIEWITSLVSNFLCPDSHRPPVNWGDLPWCELKWGVYCRDWPGVCEKERRSVGLSVCSGVRVTTNCPQPPVLLCLHSSNSRAHPTTPHHPTPTPTNQPTNQVLSGLVRSCKVRQY